MTTLKNLNGKYHGKAHFSGKPEDVEYLLEQRRNKEVQGIHDAPFVIEKIIDLDLMQYEGFCMELCASRAVFEKYGELMRIDENGVWRCILVRGEPADPKDMTGILVNAEGYDYCRYAAALGNAASGTCFDR